MPKNDYFSFMSQEVVISVEGLTKKFGAIHAVENLSFEVQRGRVTGFLGRNGAGKTTTLRAIVGLNHPQKGDARILGQRYGEIENPWLHVGTVLDAESFHPGRTGRNHLRFVAASCGLSDARVFEVLKETNIEEVADRRVKAYSLGMRQRLALATALLGDPDVLILDEPANGLDPQGMHWLRDLLVKKTHAGKTVLISSHVLAELAQFVDDIIIIDKGNLVAQGRVDELMKAQGVVHLKSPNVAGLAETLRQKGATVQEVGRDELTVRGMKAADVGDIALSVGIALHGLREENESLEDVYLRLTGIEKKG
jgi:ABC-2 type transport system ATP-binding protein